MELLDEDFAKKKLMCYRGIARLPLDALGFKHSTVLDKHRELSLENVGRLERIYEQVGCLRLQDENVVNAIVEDDSLIAALSTHGMSLDDMRNIWWPQEAPALHLEKVHCLSGMHRIEAARRFLNENDKWWTVRLFSYDTPKPVLVRIIESYSSEQKPSDGEIFRKIRLYHRENNKEAQKRWWSCLEKSKPKDLRQLLKRPSLTAGFDALIDMPGLWATVQLGALHRLLVLKCDEEMALYLAHIKEAWEQILRCGDRMLPFSAVDAATVKNLELLAPKHSETDKELVTTLMERREIFASQHDTNVRNVLLQNICAYSGIIPSLRAFFEMLKYLEPLCEALRHLLGGQMKRTIRSSLIGLYFAPPRNMVQINETEDVEIKVALSQEHAMMVAYTELWAFCSRHFDSLTAFTPRKETGEPKPRVKGPNPVVWRQLAKLALSRGFQISHAQELIAKDEHHRSQLALEYLQKAKPMCADFSKEHIQAVVEAIRSDESLGNPKPMLQLPHLGLDRRFGRPFERDLLTEKKIMFLPHLSRDPPCKNLDLRLVRRDLFWCMFAILNLQDHNFSLPTTALDPVPPLFSQDNNDADVTMSESPETDAEHVELRSRLERLQQEYHGLLSQHRILVNTSETQNKNIEELKTQNTSLIGQLENSSSKYQRLEDDHNRIIQEHSICQNIRNEFQDLQQQYQVQLEKNIELTSEYARLQQQQTIAMESQTVGREATKVQQSKEPLAIEAATTVEQLQEPLAIEATTTSASMESDGRVPDSPATYVWKNHEAKEKYEIFFIYAVNEDGEPEGHGFDVSLNMEQAISQITDILRLADTTFGNGKYHATTVLMLQLTSMEPEYLFQCLRVSSTIFIANASTLTAYASSSTASSSGSYQPTVTIEQASSDALVKRFIGLGKRKRYQPEDLAVVKYIKQ